MEELKQSRNSNPHTQQIEEPPQLAHTESRKAETEQDNLNIPSYV